MNIIKIPNEYVGLFKTVVIEKNKREKLKRVVNFVLLPIDETIESNIYDDRINNRVSNYTIENYKFTTLDILMAGTVNNIKEDVYNELHNLVTIFNKTLWLWIPVCKINKKFMFTEIFDIKNYINYHLALVGYPKTIAIIKYINIIN